MTLRPQSGLRRFRFAAAWTFSALAVASLPLEAPGVGVPIPIEQSVGHLFQCLDNCDAAFFDCVANWQPNCEAERNACYQFCYETYGD